MPAIHTYLVSFSPAERTDHGFTAEIGLMASNLKNATEVNAGSLKDLEAQVRRLAQAYGQTCSPFIRLKDRKARKPAGFEKWSSTMQIIDFVPPPADGQRDYEAEVAARPTYHDGTPRPTWDKLGSLARLSWNDTRIVPTVQAGSDETGLMVDDMGVVFHAATGEPVAPGTL